MNVAENRIGTAKVDHPAQWHHESRNVAFDQNLSRRRRISGNVLIGLVSAALLGASATKFVRVASVVTQLNGFGFNGAWVTLLGVIELASVLALIVPRTRALGLLLVTGFFGGAIATHIQHQQLPTSPALLLALCWLGVWLRHPIAFWSLAGRNASPVTVDSHSTANSHSTARPRQPNLESRILVMTPIIRWFSRAVLGIAILIFGLIGSKYILHPVAAAASSGMSLPSPFGLTNMRAGVGGFSIGCALITAMCVMSRGRLRLGLWFVLGMVAPVLLVRIYGVVADSTFEASRQILFAESLLLLLCIAALFLGRSRDVETT